MDHGAGPRRDRRNHTTPDRLGRAANISVEVGILGGIGAAVTGATDWQYTHDTARRVGLVHGALNASALGLYVASWRFRRRGSRPEAAGQA